jgi:hypothetical protein
MWFYELNKCSLCRPQNQNLTVALALYKVTFAVNLAPGSEEVRQHNKSQYLEFMYI